MRADSAVAVPRLRVAIVAPTLRILGGHSVQAARMLQGWAQGSDVDAWLVPINPLPPRPFDRLLKLKFVRTVVTQLCYWPLLLRELRRAHIAHVFSASYTGFLLSAVPAMVVGRLLGKPVVLNYHSGHAPDHLARSRLARALLRRLPTVIVVPSPFLFEVFGRYDLKSIVVFNSIDARAFRYRPRSPLRPHLLSTRNFESLYNVACTLRAFGHVQQHYPDATLTLIGGGSEETALRALAQDLQLRNVTFVGRVHPDNMPQHYSAADIYLQTPSVDNMPLSVLEAFASGLPVVATRIGGVPAILTDGIHGLLADNNDDAGIAEAVLRLLANPERALTLAARAHETCQAYEWPRVRDGWLAVYRQVVPASSDRRLVQVKTA
jgi:glycosyltransferase involved in cell wall biosynthesis